MDALIGFALIAVAVLITVGGIMVTGLPEYAPPLGMGQAGSLRRSALHAIRLGSVAAAEPVRLEADRLAFRRQREARWIIPAGLLVAAGAFTLAIGSVSPLPYILAALMVAAGGSSAVQSAWAGRYLRLAKTQR